MNTPRDSPRIVHPNGPPCHICGEPVVAAIGLPIHICCDPAFQRLLRADQRRRGAL